MSEVSSSSREEDALSFYDGIKILSVEARVKKIRGGGSFFD